MDVNELERDALCEMANIGLSRAATQLSELLDDFIEMTVPDVQVVSSDMVSLALQLDIKTRIAAVWQNFSGDNEGTSILLFPSEDSRRLVHALVGDSMHGAGEDDLRAIEHEAMTEIGNIILTSGMAVIANMLGQKVYMSMPGYMEAELHGIMEQRTLDFKDKEMMVIIMFTQLKAVQRKIEGRMVMLMTVTSVHDLLAKLRELLGGS